MATTSAGVKRPRHSAQPSALELFAFTECEWRAFRRRAAAQLRDAVWVGRGGVLEARRGGDDDDNADDGDHDVDDKHASDDGDGDGDGERDEPPTHSRQRRRVAFAAHASLLQWRHDNHRVYRSVLGEHLQLFACGNFVLLNCGLAGNDVIPSDDVVAVALIRFFLVDESSDAIYCVLTWLKPKRPRAHERRAWPMRVNRVAKSDNDLASFHIGDIVIAPMALLRQVCGRSPDIDS